MKKSEMEFAQIVKEQKSTIYTVWYMFSKDEEEVNDLFQEILINLWNGYESFEPPYVGLPREPEHLHQPGPEEKEKGHHPPVDGHQPVRRPGRRHTASGHASTTYQQARPLRPRHHPAVAREHELRGNRTDCGYLNEKRVGETLPHQGATEENVIDIYYLRFTIYFMNFVTTQHSSSKLGSVFAAPKFSNLFGYF